MGGKKPSGWAQELSVALRSERQRRDARALVVAPSSSVEAERRSAEVLGSLLEDLCLGDVGAAYDDGLTLGALALERGRVFFLAAWLRRGGDARATLSRHHQGARGVEGASSRRVGACVALLRGWPTNREAVDALSAPGSCSPEDLEVFLRLGADGLRAERAARKARVLTYVEWLRLQARRGTLDLEGRPELDAAPEVLGVRAPERARSLLGPRAPGPGSARPPPSPRASTPRSRTAQILRRTGCVAKTLPADDRPAPSPEISKWLEDRGLGNILALRVASPRSPTSVARSDVAEEPPSGGTPPLPPPSPRADELECAICLELLVDPVSTSCFHVFCSGCLKAALLRATASRRHCPLCRASLADASSARRCGGPLLARLAAARGDDPAAAEARHPRLDVRVLGSRVASSFLEAKAIGADLASSSVPLSQIRRRATALAARLDLQQLALGVAILCHPQCDRALSRRIFAFL